MLDTSYVRTRGTHLNFATDTNQAPANLLGCAGYNCGNPNPIFNAITSQNYTGWSNYNALQVRLQQRMRHGLSYQVNYAWSKSMDTGTGNGHGSGVDIYQDAYHPAANYGLSDFNSANTLVGQVTYELPFGSGRQFVLRGPLNQIAGGWRVSTIFQWHGGVPYTPVVQYSIATALDGGLTPSLSAGSTLYPDRVGNPNSSQHFTVPGGSGSHFGVGGWFNPAAFANPGAGSFGTGGRNTLVGPGFSNVDLSLGKEFPLIAERLKLEVRADAFNAFNHVNYGNPDANVGYNLSAGGLADSAAGVSNGPANNTTMRIMQLGARFIF